MKTTPRNTDPFRMTKLVISFNRHFFGLAALAIAIGLIMFFLVPVPLVRWAMAIGIATALYFIVGSVIASYFVYDHSDLYKLNIWPGRCFSQLPSSSILIHAGFDPASALLRQKYPDMKVRVLDFFERSETTEASIQRAHQLNAPTEPQESVSSANWPVASHTQDAIFVLSAAHEIRDDAKRAQFFHESKRVLANNGRIVVIEQLRNLPNFLSFGFAAFHFLSRRTWLRSFTGGGLILEKEFSISPWMRVFVLR